MYGEKPVTQWAITLRNAIVVVGHVVYSSFLQLVQRETPPAKSGNDTDERSESE